MTALPIWLIKNSEEYFSGFAPGGQISTVARAEYALENFLYNRDGEATRKAMIRYQDQLVRAHRAVDDLYRKREISEMAYVEITRILMEG